MQAKEQGSGKLQYHPTEARDTFRFGIDSRTWCQVAQECFRLRGTRLQWGTLMIPVSGPNGLGWLLNIKPGQRAWGEDSNNLDSCNGQVISNININVDFDVIKYQCSCSFTNVFSVEKVYIPCRNPGVDYCKNAIQINEINGKQHRISCSSSPASLVSTAYIQLQWSWKKGQDK